MTLSPTACRGRSLTDLKCPIIDQRDARRRLARTERFHLKRHLLLELSACCEQPVRLSRASAWLTLRATLRAGVDVVNKGTVR